MIKCKNINLDFNSTNIFSNLNIEIAQGENVCFSGPSGRGKSTLLKLFQGYIPSYVGEIFIKNQLLDKSSIQDIRKKIIWIPQNINLPVNNGIELMELMDISINLAVVNDLLMQLGLRADIVEKDFTQISGGQKQRIIIAICLSQDKDIIIMDEPTSSLDEDSIELLIQTIKSFKTKTIVSASHNQNWMDSVDRIITL